MTVCRYIAEILHLKKVTVVGGQLDILLICLSVDNGPFLTDNQSMFTEIEVASQWHLRVHNNLCPTLHKITFPFCLGVSL